MDGLQFGVFLAPRAADIGRLRDRVQVAEAAGFDFVSIQDHPYVPDFLDTFALIGTLIGETSRLRFLTDVANLPLRPAQMLAKTSASLDLLSGGRFELGLGAGRAWDQIAGLGGPRRNPRDAVAAVSEAIDVLHAMWLPGSTASLPGQHYPLTAQTGPAPAHRIGIWLGAVGPRMLDLLGRKADGWIAPIATRYETKAAAQDRIDSAARAAGRDPASICRVIQLVGTVTGTRFTTSRPRSGPGGQPIRTTPDIWAKIIAELAAEQRFGTVNLIPEQETSEQLRLFAAEVIPLARAAAPWICDSLCAGRSGPGSSPPRTGQGSAGVIRVVKRVELAHARDARASPGVCPQGGPGRRAGRPYPGGQDLRHRPGERLPVDRDGAAARPDPAAGAGRGRTAAGPAGDTSRPAPGRRPAGDPPGGYSAPRRHAGQRAPVRRRAGGPHRLRHRMRH
jgi:alkanesulfonate monooxygenase SsuD/methylene tetrahydromethanopterin reductase-like flavin-dependent oxidoreductase (luciferase family)